MGLLLPLHWQPVCLLLGALVTGASVSLSPEGCAVAFTSVERADEALDAGVDDVFVCSLTPFATRLPSVPALTLDAALEIPVHGDSYRRTTAPAAPAAPTAFAVTPADVGPRDRVLVRAFDPAVVLGVLQAGAALVLLRSGDLDAVVRAESVTRVV